MSLKRIIKALVFIMLFAAVTPVMAAEKEYIVMIDPGHGGKDAGALGRRTNEKTINLGVAKKLRDLLNQRM